MNFDLDVVVCSKDVQDELDTEFREEKARDVYVRNEDEENESEDELEKLDENNEARRINLVTGIGQLLNWISLFLHLLEICQEDPQKTSESPSLMRVEMERRRTRILLKGTSSKTSVGTVEGLAITRRLAKT